MSLLMNAMFLPNTQKATLFELGNCDAVGKEQ
jgi:hypothetical protein